MTIFKSEPKPSKLAAALAVEAEVREEHDIAERVAALQQVTAAGTIVAQLKALLKMVQDIDQMSEVLGNMGFGQLEMFSSKGQVVITHNHMSTILISSYVSDKGPIHALWVNDQRVVYDTGDFEAFMQSVEDAFSIPDVKTARMLSRVPQKIRDMMTGD